MTTGCVILQSYAHVPGWAHEGPSMDVVNVVFYGPVIPGFIQIDRRLCDVAKALRKVTGQESSAKQQYSPAAKPR